jgi:hypothetical protein
VLVERKIAGILRAIEDGNYNPTLNKRLSAHVADKRNQRSDGGYILNDRCTDFLRKSVLGGHSESGQYAIEYAIEHKNIVPQLDHSRSDLPGRGRAENHRQREGGGQRPGGDGMPRRRPHAVENALALPGVEILRVQILQGHGVHPIRSAISRWGRPRHGGNAFLSLQHA